MRRFWKKYGKAVVASASSGIATLVVVVSGGEVAEIGGLTGTISNAVFAVVAALSATGILTYAAPANREDE